MINFQRSRSCALILFMHTDPLTYREIVLPGNAVVRIGDGEIFIPQGSQRMVGPVDTFDYELVRSDPVDD
jgi:hypothetical protein